jgi:hypothetical protein
MLTEAKVLIAVAIVALVVIAGLGITAVFYKNLYDATKTALDTINASVKLQNEEAARQLQMLTAERDRKQAQIDRAAKEQETKDVQAKREINRLANELHDVRVLIRSASGQGGASAPGEASPNSLNSGGSETATYGLLPQENTRRLNEALTEVEMLSAAYGSCRAQLIPGGVIQ